MLAEPEAAEELLLWLEERRRIADQPVTTHHLYRKAEDIEEHLTKIPVPRLIPGEEDAPSRRFSEAAQSDPITAVPPAVPLRRFTVDEYHRMIDAGLFAEDEGFELLEGWIVARPTSGPPHDAAVALIEQGFQRCLPEGWHDRGKSAITTMDSAPRPDVAVIRGQPLDDKGRHPGPADLALVVEVSDATLASDRGLKARIYGRAGIPVYWIVNLSAHRVEVYTEPTGPDANPGYRERRDFEPGEALPLLIEGREVARIDVRELLP
jgi:Uma2 family endonuclease